MGPMFGTVIKDVSTVLREQFSDSGSQGNLQGEGDLCRWVPKTSRLFSGTEN